MKQLPIVLLLLIAIVTSIVSLRASDNTGALGSDAVSLVHVSPDGADYTGNPYCLDTGWTGTPSPVVNPWHDCNNITGQYHVIRTAGWDTGYSVQSWNVENFSGANATIVAYGRCGDLVEVANRPAWDPANDVQQCVVIHSTTPGETRVTLSYLDDEELLQVTSPVVKEWDSLVDSVILKPQMGDLEKVKVYYDADGDTVVETSEYKELYLPPDVNDDGKRDAADEHLLDRQGAWQDHAVVWDEALKRIKATPVVQIVEVVHGEHGEGITTHQPTEGAIVTAEIEAPRGCTYFTDADGSENFGTTLEGVSDNLGRVVVYVDTVCEEQATIEFHDDYPPGVGSLPLPVDEWIGINWTTIEEAKQPQIRWAGEEIILAKRWAFLNDWYPNATCGDGDDPCDPCPLATIGGAVYSDEDGDPDGLMDTVVTHHVDYTLDSPGLGTLEGGYIDVNGDGVLDTLQPGNGSEAIGHIDDMCISKALADSEDPGQQDTEAKLMEDTYYCPQSGPPYGEIYWDSVEGAWWCDYGTSYAPASLQSSSLVNKHAWLVWYLRVYQVKLTNVDGQRELHNDGNWNQGGGADTEEDTLNVSADTLLRVKVKGWFYNSYHSGRGDVCVDMDGDGDEQGSEKGAPYPAPPGGCADAGDEMLDNGHWVLPDDLPLLAGPDPIHTRPSWDVMSEPDAAKTAAIGPKSTLDSHDAIVRPWLGRKTVVPDGAITAADAIMPLLKIRASIASGDAGFLREALKGVVYPSTNDYHSVMIPADAEIPAVVGNGGYDWMSWTGLGPYPFWTITNKLEREDPEEVDPALKNRPWYIELYTDNRGEGMFFANGDFMLGYDDCRTDPVSGAPDCRPGNVVGNSTITVIGDYPYFRKHPEVLSNPVEKTWEWGGFKDVEAVRIDANHTAIIAHLIDRDGFCKDAVEEDPTGADGVTFSPSLHPVQGEEIEFILNTEVGAIIDVSPGAIYSAPHTPLGKASVVSLDGGVIISPDEAVALAEDGRVLDYYDEARGIDEGLVAREDCQAWVVIEHPSNEEPDITVLLHDPEGDIQRYWPPTPLPPVGGIAELPDLADSSRLGYIALAALAAAALVALSAGGWYARRRRVR
ncbi:MAG: hypothetical protein MUP14_05330 [Dehalococcoidia bacterium]|nr:hypothetical protein [Dehalococcoidia bacterium]